jgi:glucose/arabinose dehydrogenase
MKNVKIFLAVAFAIIAITANAQNNAGLKLPQGFKATLFADTIGSARHIAITSNGVLFAKLMYPNKAGKSIIRLEDKNNDGVADQITGWGNYGGTGIFVKGKSLYATSDNDVFLYQLNDKDEVVNPLSPKTIVKGLIARNQHASKSITLDAQNNVYVNIGAYSNACQEKDRMPGSKGMMPCPILDSAGGIWKFDGSKENQVYGDGIKYATGLRNVVG